MSQKNPNDNPITDKDSQGLIRLAKKNTSALSL